MVSWVEHSPCVAAQFELASERVAAAGVAHLVTFEIVDYRDFAKAHKGERVWGGGGENCYGIFSGV